MKDDKKNKRKNILIIVSVILGAIVAFTLQVLFLIWAFSMSENDFEINENGEVIINDGDLTIGNDINGYYSSDDDCYHIDGVLINHSKKQFNYIDISYTFYDKDDYILGSENSYLESIKGNGKWKFNVTYCGNDAKTITDYELSNIDYYSQ